MAAAAVSVSAAVNAGNVNVAFREHTADVDRGSWTASRDAEHAELDPAAGAGGEEEGPSRRVDEELSSVSPEELQGRLDRTRREFYNRRKITIKNLPSDIANQEVHELLGNYDLKYCFVDKYKGTAFVTLLNGEQAQGAIKEFHRHVLRDRELAVQLQPTDALLCIANLPHALTQQQFEELVRPFGNLERCFLVYSAATGHSKGYGFVEYMKKDSAARAKAELLGKQLGSRMLYVHWTEVGSLTYPLLHSRCLCVERLPPSLVTAQDLRHALADTPAAIFCQLAQGQDASFRRFAVLEFSSADMAEEARWLADGRLLGSTHIRVSFCAPGPPGRSMLAALIAAQTMAVNRGKGLLPDPTAMQILTGLSNPATLKMLLNPMSQGRKQGILGMGPPPSMPLLANPALSAALLQMLLQNQAQVQQAGLMGENPLATMPLQQGLHLLGDLPQGLPADALAPLKPMSLNRGLGRDQESPTLGCSFRQTPSPTLPGSSMPHMAGMMGADGFTPRGLSILGVPPTQGSFHSGHNMYSSGANCRPHPYRKRQTLSNASNQSLHANYNLRYQESYSPEYPPLHQDPLAHLYEQQENLDAGALPGFGLQLSCPPEYGELTMAHYGFSPSPPLTPYFNSAPGPRPGHALPSGQLNKAVGMPPMSNPHDYLGNSLKTPVGGHKRVFSRLIPSPEPSPEGGYVGQHSQGLGGHYADSYLKRKRIF
ncbi:hypothetical protein NHX12_000684 [Muraenolepis orangiensis]|uniref:Ribonucleoprotein PTB-binding 1 n=1 Tax=Muraenolepis orangiensis TaxID=630683 RepID=A0A9Q0IIX1_9TELE|nr:hypothetical protein NHX12_000684 [Muraenolepis orangiensis]